ncbi:2-hydroxychromene-2-carboxylate isomerase [Amycolatopsis sulphurea]|uniref:2-hydroxychromene-2-carboxylate isomerase n=1 Tax=Amycolatopsis sulphurea TaxID=76022 RepID=A0A2A9FHC0_9PSEU|nr:DsbA family protein [Amycolatopsis sulphurea]PFG49910.1 2-hydroxychromene-2-carboxylate isomerase [Amycolatopsis sulphurea]
MAAKPPRWYFSLRSPYSWLAHHDLLAHHPDVADRVEWIPFWEPDERTQAILDEDGVQLPIVDMSRAKNFYILQDARRLAEARGLSVTWPVDRDPNWEIAHLGYLVAEAAGRGREYVALVYRARWQESRDITDRATIAEIATELGLDAARVAGAADDPEIRRHGADTLIRSYKDGLFGVPFFLHGRDKYFGVDRLRAWVAKVRGETPEAGVELDWLAGADRSEPVRAGADIGPAGGCG